MDVKIIENSSQIGDFMEIIKSAWHSESAISGFKDTIHSMAYHGGFVLGAFDGNKLIGMSFSYPGYRNGHVYLYSHMTGVIDENKYSGVGYMLKMKQRELAINYGYDMIAWTFDPAMSLNGYFNIGKLGAISRTYLDNFYGTMDDGINKGLPTDRLVAEWHVLENYDRSYSDPQFINEVDGNHIAFNADPEKDLVGVKIIKNFYEYKKADLDGAIKLKILIRQKFHELFSKGYVIINFERKNNAYIFKKNFKLNKENIF
jgi:predicted GNAT superfamily acetyltransferase